MLKQKPLSIVIPAHNEAAHIPRLIRSIQSFLSNQFELQIILIDNGSIDDTSNVVEHLEIEYIKLTEKCCPARARNIGLHFAKNEVIVFSDADMELTQEWADSLIKDYPSLLAQKRLITGARCVTPQGASWIEKVWFDSISKQPSYINGSNIITNKTTMDLIGGFDEELETGEDVDLCVKAQDSYGVDIIVNNGYISIHHGFPKTLKHFFMRERWHAKGDLNSLHTFLKSKVALASSLFLFLNTTLIASALLGSGLYSMLSFIMILLLCISSALSTFKGQRLRTLSLASLLYYIYYLGRAASLLERVSLRKKAN
jgi:glycosyltransferase involved in cell wall biosynthesis